MSLVQTFAILSMSMTQATQPCPPEDGRVIFHAPPLCDFIFDDVTMVVGVTFEASLNPRPAKQQVVLYFADDAYVLSVHGYRWDREGGLFETRRREMEVDAKAVGHLLGLASEGAIEELAKIDYYGNLPGASADEIVICTDGSSLTVGIVSLDDGGAAQMTSAERHSCSDERGIDEIASAFREEALRLDPEFAGFLSGLGR